MDDRRGGGAFSIAGTRVPLGDIVEYRLGRMEVILRPVYRLRARTLWEGLLGGDRSEVAEYYDMEYYAAVIGSARYLNAVDAGSAIERAAADVSRAFRRLIGRRGGDGCERLMNAAGNVFERRADEIPARVFAEDGRTWEIWPGDEGYSRLGEALRPSRELAPALFIRVRRGTYVFLGNGIQIADAKAEYRRLERVMNAARSGRRRRPS